MSDNVFYSKHTPTKKARGKGRANIKDKTNIANHVGKDFVG